MRIRSFGYAFLSLWALSAYAGSVTLGSAGQFAVLGGAGVTNEGIGVLGSTVVTGNVGGSVGTPAVTGFPPGIVNGTLYLTGAPNQAFADLTTAYNTASGMTQVIAMPANLGNLTLSPGVYSVPAGDNLTGTLKLVDGGINGSVFVFLMDSSLTTDPGSSIDVSNLHSGDALYWVVRSSATLGANTNFAGNILAESSITFNPGATDLCGRALAQTGSVTFAGQSPTTLIENQVSIGCTAVPTGLGGGGFDGVVTPEPGTLFLLGSCIVVSFGKKISQSRLRSVKLT